MICWVTRLGGLPGLADRVPLSAGVTVSHVNVSRWDNPPGRGRVTSFALNSNHNNMAAQGKRKDLVLSENEEQATTSSTTPKKSKKCKIKKKNKAWTSDQVEVVHKRLQNEVRVEWNRFRSGPSFHVYRNTSLHGRGFSSRIWPWSSYWAYEIT